LEAQGTGFHATGRGFHVLVVDDDQDTAEILCALLRIWGYQSEALYDAIHGLQFACEHHPECLIVDIDIPGFAGHTLARELRLQPGFDRVNLIALSFHSDDAHIRCSLEAGFDFYFVKPMEQAQFRSLKELMGSLSEVVQFTAKTDQDGTLVHCADT
jgi:DNA-binding response OmpR family regulator